MAQGIAGFQALEKFRQFFPNLGKFSWAIPRPLKTEVGLVFRLTGSGGFPTAA
jgi:hypothetical protein